MSLDQYMQSAEKRQVSLKAALRRMRSKWYEGPVSSFDRKLALILNCTLEDAMEVRDHWVECGLLGINRRGLLTWRTGGF